jgi:two-component system chemotaxis sensor kinase CheA
MTEKLEQLVNEAALAVNTLDAGDKKDLQNLRKILGEIDSSSGTNEQKSRTADAIGIIESILKETGDASSEILDKLSQSISSIQQLLNQTDNAVPAAAAKQTSPSAFSEDDLPLVYDFITESGEHIQNAEGAMLEIETTNNPEAINKVFRAFHTVKGLAGFLNLKEINSLAHSAENLLVLARDGKIKLDAERADIVFESMDTLKKMIASVKTAADTNTLPEKFAGLDSLVERLGIIASGNNPVKPAAIASPTKEKAEPENKLPRKEDKLIEAVLSVQNSDDKRTTVRRAEDQAKIVEAKSAEEDSIRVSIGRLDRLVNLAGELVIAQLMVSEQVKTELLPEHPLARKAAEQSKIIRDLQELSMSMRMVPVRPVFQKLARLIRDLSKKAGKTIDLVTAGEDTELDRTLVDKISDPLVHMVRNAVDHGIEDTQTRQKLGKKTAGKIELRAYHKAGSIIIEITDDGKGLDKDKILQKAISQGLVQENNKLSDDEIYKLIFHPGLSTAEKITDVSGRGVGMDVVRKNIDSISGRIDITTTKGQGAVFTISLPLTLATIEGQVVKVGSSRYIIPVKSIVRSFRPTENQVSTIQNKGEMVLVHNDLIRVIRLHKLFGVNEAKQNLQEALFVEIEQNGCKACLLVDELLSQQQVVIKSLGHTLGSIKGISGAAIMGDGRVSLIIDAGGILGIAE